VSFDTTASRFLRPADVSRLRRNQRRIHVQRLLVLLRGAGLAATLAVGGFWAWRHTQSDERFAVRAIEIAGATHTPKAALDVLTRQYVGMNLFQMDIARVQRDLGGLGWVRSIDIEKKLPDTLRIKISEREPIALVRSGDRLLYVDQDGTGFAELSAAVGDPDLPIIGEAYGAELARTVKLLQDLRRTDEAMFSRVSEVWPIAPHGFAIYDRELGAVIYANASDVTAKYRDLRAVLAAENNPKIEYADLRFADRVIVKAKASATTVTRTQEGSALSALAAGAVLVSPVDAGRQHVQN
jgi:cell division septal protein FtsQ